MVSNNVIWFIEFYGVDGVILSSKPRLVTLDTFISIQYDIIDIPFVYNSNKRIEFSEADIIVIGTGYRVYSNVIDNGYKTIWEVGYSKPIEYNRHGTGWTIKGTSSYTSRKLSLNSLNAKAHVGNQVNKIIKRRVVSRYTGSGVVPSTLVGKIVRKSTKPVN